MRQIEFSEDQLGNLHEIAMELFSQPEEGGNPRQLIRPKINWFSVALNCLLPPLLWLGLYLLLQHWGLGAGLALGISLGLLGVYILLRLKQGLICLVKIYQRLAPASIRNRCLFEPSCSQYTILCLEKYGLVKGVPKSIRRMARCKLPNGGIDMP